MDDCLVLDKDMGGAEDVLLYEFLTNPLIQLLKNQDFDRWQILQNFANRISFEAEAEALSGHDNILR